MACEGRDIKLAEEEAAGDKDKLQQLKNKIRLYKYVGESSRSMFERGWEHVADYENLSTKSHMLKHVVEIHPEEELMKIQFGIKIIKTAKTSFERQIFESVEIQENRHHHLLNSRSEYNRCAVPRLTCKLGDKAFKKYEKEMVNEIEKEEEQVAKIRQLVKNRNRERKNQKAPPPKRRKMEEGYITPNMSRPEIEKSEKRKQGAQDEGPHPKRRKEDIREMFKKQEVAKDISQEKEKEKEKAQTIFYGEEEAVEVENWEEIFRKHQEETTRLKKKTKKE